ncbi:hypothetical protein AgCh_021021 [Apium graveolens]
MPIGRRRPRTRGGSTSVAFPHPRPAPLDGYGFGQTSQGHGFTGSPMEHTYVGRGFTGYDREHTSQGRGSTGSHMEHTVRGLDKLLRISMPFMSHDTFGSRYASPVVREADDDDEEEPHDLQVRQQPPRAVKSQGRICHTGSKYCRLLSSQ